jgi:hypothetical protein
MLIRSVVLFLTLTGCCFAQSAGTHPSALKNSVTAARTALPPADEPQYEYRLLATNKTSTMQKEMNEAAAEGFRFGAVMGGETAFGGNEAVVIMVRETAANTSAKQRYRYLLLATNKTGTMQKEMTEAGTEGFEYKGQTIFQSTFGGQEVCVIMELDKEAKPVVYEYKLLATNRTSTMQKEIAVEGKSGYLLVGMTVSKTAFGGSEVVAILRRIRS